MRKWGLAAVVIVGSSVVAVAAARADDTPDDGRDRDDVDDGGRKEVEPEKAIENEKGKGEENEEGKRKGKGKGKRTESGKENEKEKEQTDKEQKEEKEEKEKEAKERREKERVRFGLGIAIGSMGGIGSGAGGAGAGGLWPYATVGIDLHATGPLWVTAKLSGTYSEASTNEATDAWYSVGGRVGPRIEVPTFDWLEVGGYAVLQGGYSASCTWAWGMATSGYLGGVAGLAAHLRPTDFFGVRLGLDVFSVNHWWAESNGQTSENTSVALTASPTLELTFTF